MPKRFFLLSNSRSAFTLIELLVVIAIIAILSVVVILTLNPIQLLEQSRDSNRLSDVATLNDALGIYIAQGGASLGSSSVVYVSIPDLTATSTVGDQCQGLGLPAAPSGTTYFCAASSTYRSTGGTGWMPVTFSSIPTGAPLGQLPQDPINQTSSGLYYAYATDGTHYISTGLPESQKQKQILGSAPTMIPDYPDVIAEGSSLQVSPLFSATGLVAYWNFEEGMGSTTDDLSGSGNGGTWNGASSGGSHYTGGKVGGYSGNFDGSTNYIATNKAISSLYSSSNGTMSAWIFPVGAAPTSPFVYAGQPIIGDTNEEVGIVRSIFGGSDGIWAFNYSGSAQYVEASDTTNQWIQVVWVHSGGILSFYVNGSLIGSISSGNTGNTSGNIDVGGLPASGYYFNGHIDELRIYNRALSASEIAALYNAEK